MAVSMVLSVIAELPPSCCSQINVGHPLSRAVTHFIVLQILEDRRGGTEPLQNSLRAEEWSCSGIRNSEGSLLEAVYFQNLCCLFILNLMYHLYELAFIFAACCYR